MIDDTAQANLFAARPDLLPHATSAPYIPTTEHVRARMLGMMQEVQAFRDTLPWTESELFVARTVFHNMVNWLPEAERASARAAYVAELVRRGAPEAHPTTLPRSAAPR